MKKRWGTMLLAGLLGTALLSGCGSSASDSASSAAESNPSETTTTAEGTKEDLIFVNPRFTPTFICRRNVRPGNVI